MPRGRPKGLIALTILILLILLPIALTIIPKGSDGTRTGFVVKRGTKIGAIARSLEAEGRVSTQYLFLLCSLLMYKGRVVAGEYDLSKNMSIMQIARKMAYGERRVYTLKIVEGYNLFTLSDVIQKAGIMEKQAFLQLARNPEFLRRFDIPSDSLEGYLRPDTYFFSKETEVDEFLEKIVQRTFKLFEEEDVQQRMQKLGMSAFQALSLASIIEKEAKLEGEKRLMSAVFHNRLRRGMTLDADPTVIYGRESFNRDLTKSDLAADTPYNTYRMKGLPKGPICSPSRSSILAALYPEQSDALYFVSKNDGSHVFSKTIQEHNHFVMTYQRRKGEHTN